MMIDIDWGDLRPSRDLRAAVESRMEVLAGLHRERVVLRRRGSGYEVQVRTALPGQGTMLRMHGDDLEDVIDRAAELLLIVACETARQRVALAS